MVLHPHSQNQDESSFNVTANIIFNLAHLGISITDTKYIDIETYFELVKLEMNVLGGKEISKRATQADIGRYFM